MCRDPTCADDVDGNNKTLTLPNDECITSDACGTNPHTTVSGTTCVCDTALENGMDTWYSKTDITGNASRAVTHTQDFLDTYKG